MHARHVDQGHAIVDQGRKIAAQGHEVTAQGRETEGDLETIAGVERVRHGTEVDATVQRGRLGQGRGQGQSLSHVRGLRGKCSLRNRLIVPVRNWHCSSTRYLVLNYGCKVLVVLVTLMKILFHKFLGMIFVSFSRA